MKILLLTKKNKNKTFFEILKDQKFKKLKIYKQYKKIDCKTAKNFDLIISYNYGEIVPPEVLKNCKNIINLHISYLPYNRGAYPVFWSFAENTPVGVTIHSMNEVIDGGNIIYQKIKDFELIKNRKKLTFRNAHAILESEIEDLFFKNFKQILNQDYLTFPKIGKGTHHTSNELPKELVSWDQNIYSTILKYNKRKKLLMQNKLKLIDEVEKVRTKNNVNWMNLLRVSFKNNPDEAMKIFKKINLDDEKISSLFKKLND